jgi:hypothetical protein
MKMEGRICRKQFVSGIFAVYRILEGMQVA